MADLRQSPAWAKYLEVEGFRHEKLGSDFVFIRKLPANLSLIKIPRASTTLNLKKLDYVAKTNKALFTKIEFDETNPEKIKNLEKALEKKGYIKDNWSLQSTKTIVLDLRKSEEELLSDLDKDTRYSIRKAREFGVEFKEDDDLDNFLGIYQSTAKRQKFWTGSIDKLRKKYEIFKKENKAKIYFANLKSGPIATCLILIHNKSAYYLHAGTTQEARETFAAYLLLWEVILRLKKEGLNSLDLEGIYDPRIKFTKKWKGFTLFKKGFGGREVEFPNSYTKYYFLPLKVLFSLLGKFI